MNKLLIKELIADAEDFKVGQRMRAVAYTVLSIAAYAYTAGLMTAEAVEKMVRWYETYWVKQEPSSSIETPMVSDPVVAFEVIEEPQVIKELELSSLAPTKTKRRKAVGFA